MADNDQGEKPGFRKSIGPVRPLPQTRVAPYRARRKPVPAQSQRDAREEIDNLLSNEYEPAEIEIGEELVFARPGLQHSVLRKLRRGQYALEAELDLHGCTVPQAREQLLRFINEARAFKKRCVRVIHGKGKRSDGKLPVLKGRVNVWLRQRDEVLAFCTATRRDGGAGALYVLLKRKG